MDKLKEKPEEQEDGNLLYSWHANLVTINRRNGIVLVNDKNLYTVIMHGITAKEIKDIDKHICEAIRKTFKNDGIKDEIIDKYLEIAEGITFTKTGGTQIVARMNSACKEVDYRGDYLDEDSLIKTRIAKSINGRYVGRGKNQYINPAKEMYRDLEEEFKEDIFQCEALQLKISLNLDGIDVWRRLVIPSNFYLEDLHRAIQRMFNWLNYHLHEFFVYPSDIEVKPESKPYSCYHEKKPLLNIVCDEEAFDYPNDIPMEMNTWIRVADVFTKNRKVKYVYDLGDYWEHNIQVEKVIEDYDKNYMECLAGDGIAPPEDVGGAGGFKEFLNVMKDVEHPEHDDYKNWAIGNGYIEFDIEEVNRWIKN